LVVEDLNWEGEVERERGGYPTWMKEEKPKPKPK
jgi:hypothetical protein